VEQAQELEALSQRPFATVRAVFRDDIPEDEADQLMFRPVPVPRGLRHWCVPVPVAEQPLAGLHEGDLVTAYLVELPSSRGSLLQVGVTLTGAPERSRRGRKKPRHSNSRVATSAM
jgi:hypothetical protein